MRLAAIALVALCTTSCAGHEEHATGVSTVVADYIDHLPSPSTDPRAGMLIGFVHAAEDMLGSSDPVENHVDTVTLRSTCMQLGYGIRGSDRLQDAIDHLAITPQRRARWIRYVIISSQRASILPDDQACNF